MDSKNHLRRLQVCCTKIPEIDEHVSWRVNSFLILKSELALKPGIFRRKPNEYCFLIPPPPNWILARRRLAFCNIAQYYWGGGGTMAFINIKAQTFLANIKKDSFLHVHVFHYCFTTTGLITEKSQTEASPY